MAKRRGSRTIQDENQISFFGRMDSGDDGIAFAVEAPKQAKPKPDKEKQYMDQMEQEKSVLSLDPLPKPEDKIPENAGEETDEPKTKDNAGGSPSKRKPRSGRGNRSDWAMGSLFDDQHSGDVAGDNGSGGEIDNGEPAAEQLSGTITASRDVEARGGRTGNRPVDIFAAADNGLNTAATAEAEKPDVSAEFVKAKKKPEESEGENAQLSLLAFDSAASIPATSAPSLPFDKAVGQKSQTIQDKPETTKAPNFKYSDDFNIGEGGPKTKAQNNIAAIRTVKTLLRESRDATDEERETLAKFVGWGGLPQIFDEKNAKWSELYAELKELLSDEEYEAARFSTINAHYTNRDVVEAMWDGLQGLGFDGGNVLEPGMGVGYFMGLAPDDIRGDTKLTGVELDPMTGQIARALYTQADVRIEGFEKTRMRMNSFDAAIGNVPFGDIVLRDAAHNKGRHSIHDHFINKSLDLAKPGAIASFVTSRYTMDKMNPAARRELENKADLLGAIRLPSNTFAGNAGTAVVTDILVFRKRHPDEEKQPQEWVKTGQIEFGETKENKARINQYFVDNPDMMLGQIEYGRGMYSDEELRWVADEDVPIRAQIDLAFQKIIDDATSRNLKWNPADVDNDPSVQNQQEMIVDEDIEEGSFYLADKGDIYQYSQGHGNLVMKAVEKTTKENLSATERDYDVVRRFIEMKNVARDVLRLQMGEWDEGGPPPWEAKQRRLNFIYNQFVTKHGAINSVSKRRLPVGASGEERFSISRKYLKLFRDDPACNFVRALEIYNDETGQAVKSDIFTSRVVSPDRSIQGVENAYDGLVASLTAPDRKGKIDIGYIADLTGTSQEDVIQELGDNIFKNPENEEWETDDSYLSGNVRVKLEIAKTAAQKDNKFMRNVAALEQVIPEDLSPQQIDVALGAPWIPEDVMAQFVNEILEMPPQHHDELSVAFYPEESLWRVKGSSYRYTGDAKVNVEWGTSRKPMLEILADTMNQKSIEIYDSVEDNKKVKNAKATLAAKEKQQKLIKRFREWIWEDESRAEKLARIYNDRYNNIRLRQYKNPSNDLPGMNNLIKLREHQLNVIWRIVQKGNTLMGHAVGAGKTLAAIGASMEEKRLGLTNKPLHVVPNHMLDQYATDFQKAYPDAKILVADKDDFTGDRRKHFVAQCATGNWDAVIMTHSSFGKIGVSPEREAEFLHERIAEYTSMIERAKDDDDNFTVKRLEKMKKNREEKIQNLLNSDIKDKGITFEEMGIDRLYVDEAHLFKNLEFSTRTKGVSQSASQRAMDLFMKIRYLEEVNPERSAVFMTGTPIANSVAEAFTMMRYLYLDKMKEGGIDNFDSWISMFGEFVTALELAPDGGSYRMHSRLAKFCNVPELKQMFLEFADIMTSDMLDLPKPKLKGGKHTVITVPPSEELNDYIQDLVRRAEAVKNREVEPHEDNMLKITSDGRKAALDLREIGMDVADSDQEGLKLKRAAEEIAKRYHDTKNNQYMSEDGEIDPILGAIQSVFCDLSTPKKDGSFSAYDKLREYLVALDVPATSIRFIHEYNDDKKKAQLFEDCRNGKVAVVLGSTQKMGFGTNIQKRMIAQHHLDAPWRPADIEQRDGRIERQGNQNDEIEILRYVTEGSFDIYMWQALERKAKFIAQIMSPLEATVRSFEDNDVKSLSFAEVKAIATGDTRLIEQAEIESKLAKIASLRETHRSEQWRLKSDIKSHHSRIEMNKTDIANIDAMTKGMEGHPVFDVDGIIIPDAKKAGQPLMQKVRQQYTESNFQAKGYLKSTLGNIHGYPIILETGGKIGSETLRVTVRAPYEIETVFYEEDLEKMRSETILNRLKREFERLPEYRLDSVQRIERNKADIERKSQYVGAEFDQEEEYQTLSARQKEIEESLRPTDDEAEIEEQMDVEEGLEAVEALVEHDENAELEHLSSY